MDKEQIKEHWPKITLLIIAIILLVFFGFQRKDNEINIEAPRQSSYDSNDLSEEAIKNQVGNILDVLMRIHYVSLIEKAPTSPDSVIIDELTESMNDLNKLKGLLFKTEELSKSGNEIISTTGLATKVTTLSLIQSYNSWIQYLRSVDINDVNLSEFQYQLALFQSSTHDAYLTLVEGAPLLPMITVEFAKEENQKNTINEDLKNYFLTKIDDLFDDILVDDDAFYQETKNRYAIAVLIRGYKEFFE